MEKISVENVAEVKNEKTEFENSIIENHDTKKKMAKGFFSIAGIALGAFICLVVIASATTDAKLREFEDLAGFLLDFFLLLFCSYSMYVTSSDSGMRAGLRTEEYKQAVDAFEKMKQRIIAEKRQGKLGFFCADYIKNELRRTRTAILALVGIDIDAFEARWRGADKKLLKQDKCVTKAQRKAILAANSVTAVKLTPEMLMRRGRGRYRRAPLGITPEGKKGINFSAKFVSTIVTVLALSLIALEPAENLSWITFAKCCIKLIAVIVNGYSGYKFGYENIVFDTVEYVEDQTDLLQEAIDWMDEENN